MKSKIIYFLQILVIILTIYERTFAQQFTEESAPLDSSAELENQLLNESRQDYHNGFHDIVSVFTLINTTMLEIDARLRNLEVHFNALKKENDEINARLGSTELKTIPLGNVDEDNKTTLMIKQPLSTHLPTNTRPETDESEITPTEQIVNDNKTTYMIKQLLANPRARIFSGDYFTGNFVDIERVGDDCLIGECEAMKNFSWGISSVKTFGTCVRLFQDVLSQSAGWSIAIYPGNEIQLRSRLSRARGIGPCLSNEFDGATIDSSTQLIKKNLSDVRKTVPDFAEFFNSYGKEQKGTLMNTTSLGRNDVYTLGSYNRVEYLSRTVYKSQVRSNYEPSTEMENTDFYRSLDKLPGDVLGFGIPVALGGPDNETFNIFPQTPRGAKEWLQITSDIPSFVRKSTFRNNTYTIIWVIIQLNFLYENLNSTRPYAFNYFLNYNRGKSLYGRVNN